MIEEKECSLCSDKIIKKSEKEECIVCGDIFCLDCSSKMINPELIYFPKKEKVGYCCVDQKCLEKTRKNLKNMIFDLNPIVDTIDNKIQDVKNEFEIQKSKTKNDLNDLIKLTSDEKIPKLISETNKIIESKLDEIKLVFEEQKSKTKDDINEIIDKTIKEKIKPFLIFIGFFIPVVILIISGLITLEVVFLIKYIS